MKNVLLNSTGYEFYRRRIGFFIAIFLLAFGGMSAREHYGIALFLMGVPIGQLSWTILWGAYTVMVLQFVNRLWKMPAYTFIYAMGSVGFFKRIGLLILLMNTLLLPITSYGLWMIYVAYQENMIVGPILGVIIWSLLFMIGVGVLNYRINYPNRLLKPKKRFGSLSYNRPTRWDAWLLEWIIRERGLTLLLAKLGSFSIVIGTLLYYGTDTYDVRMPALGVTLAVMLQIGLLWEMREWEHSIWPWNQTIPITLIKRICSAVNVLIVLLLTDWILLLRYGYTLLSGMEIIGLVLLQLSVALLYYSYVYSTSATFEKSMTKAFQLFILLTFAILYRTPLMLLASILLGITIVIFMLRKKAWNSP